MSFERRAIVMGASSGMGRAVAQLLLAQRWHVGLAARRGEALEQLREQYPQHATTAVIDVTDTNAGNQLLSLVERMGGIDLYFHASGIGKQNPNVDPEVELATVATNGTGFTRMVDTIFGYMAAHGGGHIAAITSIAGTKGLGAAPAYSATKAFQNTYLQALEQLSNMRRLGISFTDIRPGFVATALLADEHHYPMLMDTEATARRIVKAVLAKKHVAVVDWRYRCLVALWRRVPRCVWRHLPIHTKD